MTVNCGGAVISAVSPSLVTQTSVWFLYLILGWPVVLQILLLPTFALICALDIERSLYSVEADGGFEQIAC